MIPDEEIRKIMDFKAIPSGIEVKIVGLRTWLKISIYHAYRISVFLDRAILDYKALTGKSIDEEFLR
jgi:hypothetical protein